MNPQSLSLSTLGATPQPGASAGNGGFFSGVDLTPGFNLGISDTLNPAAGGGSVTKIAPASNGAVTSSGSGSPIGNQTSTVNPASNTVPGTTSSGSTPNSLIQQGISNEYGAAIQGAQGLLQAYPGQETGALNALNNYVNSQQNQITQGTQNQVNTYNTQESGVQNQQNLSLAQLADQIRGQNQGLQAQLGATGAGSSSAAGMGQFALAHEQNANRAAIETQAGGNIANIEAQKQQVQNALAPQIDVLNKYKDQQTQLITSNYNNLMHQVETQMQSASGEEQRQLGLFATNLSQAAGDALTKLSATLDNAAQDLISRNQSTLANAPAAYVAPATAAAPAAIQAPQVSPFQINSGAGNASAPTGGSLATILQQQQNAIA